MESVIDQTVDCRSEEFDLVAAIRRADTHAHETFVWRFSGGMLAAARQYFPCEHDCDDAVQEAFISAFQAIDKFKGKSTLRTWLHRIVVNDCLMMIRSRARRRETFLSDLLPSVGDSGQYQQSTACRRQAVDHQIQGDDSRMVVRRCIDRLPKNFRRILLLRDIEERSTAETATTLNITPGAVKTRLYRARQALRMVIDACFKGEE